MWGAVAAYLFFAGATVAGIDLIAHYEEYPTYKIDLSAAGWLFWAYLIYRVIRWKSSRAWRFLVVFAVLFCLLYSGIVNESPWGVAVLAANAMMIIMLLSPAVRAHVRQPAAD
jgi:hypothetical protein